MPMNLFSPNKFKFELTGERFLNSPFNLSITGMNLPGISLGTIPMGTHIRQIDRPGDSLIFNDLNVEFLITENLSEWKVIYDWLNDLRDFNKSVFDNNILSQGSLVLLTNKHNPNLTCTFKDLFPFDLSDLDLNLNIQDGETLKGNVSFKYISYEVK